MFERQLAHTEMSCSTHQRSKGKENVKKYRIFLSIDYMLILYLGYTELIMLKLISPGLKLFTGATRNLKLHMRPAFNFLIDSTRREFQSSTFPKKIVFLFYFLAALRGMWDFSSPTRDLIHDSCIGSSES